MQGITTYKALNMKQDNEYFNLDDIEYLILNGKIKQAQEYLEHWGKMSDKNILRHFEAYVKRYYTNQYKIDK